MRGIEIGTSSKLYGLLSALAALSVLALLAEPAIAEQEASEALYKPIAAALSVGLAGLGAGIAIAVAGASGLSALAEKPEIFSSVLLVVALAEGIAIYGLIVALLLIIM